MVAAEAAAAGCPPLVARHSGLAEIAAGLEEAYPPELRHLADFTSGDVDDLRAKLREMGEKIEPAAHERLEQDGIEHELVLIDSRPAPGLAQVAEERDARMVIVGGAGEAPLKGALLGATPHKLLNLTDRPVLVVRSVE